VCATSGIRTLFPRRAALFLKPNMLFEYFIFKVLPDGALLWMGDAQTLEEAKIRMSSWAQKSPGAYSVYSIRNRAAPVCELKPDTQPGDLVSCNPRRFDSLPRNVRNLSLLEAYLQDLARVTLGAAERELIAEALASVREALQSSQARGTAAGSC
jgi:hypothetical protein